MEKRVNSIRYALREIILVVIGILIAVSINNWNEKRKQKIELKNILLVIKEDIKNDIEEVSKVLGQYEQMDSLYRKILTSELKEEDYIKNPRLAFFIFGYPEISFDKRGIGLLEKFKSNSELVSTKLLQDISVFYTERMQEIKVDDDLRKSDFNDNFKYWKKNADWWPDFLEQNDFSGFIKYALNSKDYKSRVSTYYFLTYKIYLPEIQTFKEQGLEIVDRIESLK